MQRQTLAVRLKALRLSAGLTQAELAERMGTSQAKVANVEGAKLTPRLDLIERWARATGRRLTLEFGSPQELSPEDRRERIAQAFGPDAFDPWERDPTPVEQRTLRRLGITPTEDRANRP